MALFDATFTGAGETLSAALVALPARGYELPKACAAVLDYLDKGLEAGCRPGMGQVILDRMFWAEPEDLEDAPADAVSEAVECSVLPPPLSAPT